jgi:hypothetical protein
VCTASVCTKEHQKLHLNYRLFTVYWQPAFPSRWLNHQLTHSRTVGSPSGGRKLCVLLWRGTGTAIRTTPAVLVQGGHRDICRVAACRFVGKFQMITLGYPGRLFLFVLSPVAGNFPATSIHRPIRYLKSYSWQTSDTLFRRH